jgi:hypothetical protein
MKSFLLTELSRRVWIAVALIILTACTSQSEKRPYSASACPSPYSFRYADSVHGFSVCLPAKVKKGDASDYPAGSVVFTGFAVPAKTNLQAKQLIIVPGKYDIMESATAFGHLTADGVTFKRLKAEEGSAGHLTLHMLYAWKKGSKEIHFDFAHRSVDVGNFDPYNRPAEYNRSAQIKMTEQIMRTFREL